MSLGLIGNAVGKSLCCFSLLFLLCLVNSQALNPAIDLGQVSGLRSQVSGLKPPLFSFVFHNLL